MRPHTRADGDCEAKYRKRPVARIPCHSETNACSWPRWRSHQQGDHRTGRAVSALPGPRAMPYTTFFGLNDAAIRWRGTEARHQPGQPLTGVLLVAQGVHGNFALRAGKRSQRRSPAVSKGV